MDPSPAPEKRPYSEETNSVIRNCSREMSILRLRTPQDSHGKKGGLIPESKTMGGTWFEFDWHMLSCPPSPIIQAAGAKSQSSLHYSVNSFQSGHTPLPSLAAEL